MKPKILFISFYILSIFNGYAQDGNNLFNDAIVHTLEINKPSNPGLIDSLIAWHNAALFFDLPERYDTVTIIFDGTPLTQTGIRCKGRESFLQEYLKKPFKIKPSKFISQTLDGIKEFNLHPAMGDPSQLRDKLSYDLFRNEGIQASRTSFTKVYLNGEYWGLYTIVEVYNKSFLEENFGNKDGNLYKANHDVGSGAPLFDWPITGQPTTSADTFALMHGMELKTNKSTADHSKYIKLLDIINNTPSANFADSIVNYFNVASFLKIIAIDFTMLNTDGYLQGGDNFYMYYNTNTNLFEWVPWDYNWTMNYLRDGSSIDPAYKELGSNPMFTSNNLLEKILDVPQFKLDFHQNICNFLSSQFNSTEMNQRVDTWKSLIENDVNNDTNKSFTNNDFDNNTEYTSVPFFIFPTDIPGLKQFVEDRNQFLTNQFSVVEFTCTPITSAEQNVKHNLDMTIFPNPTTNYFKLKISNKILNSEFIIINYLGSVLLKGHLATPITHINISEFPKGIYYLKGNYLAPQKYEEKF